MRPSLLSLPIAAVLCLSSAACDTSRQESLQTTSEALNAFSNGDQMAAMRRLEDAVALDPSNAHAHYYLGLIRLQHFGDAAGALPSLQEAATRMADSADAQYQLGIALTQLDRPAEARAALEGAVSADPAHGRAMYRIGRLSEEAGDVYESIDWYTRSIHASLRFPMAYNALGTLYLRLGRPQEAMAVLLNGVSNENPDDPDTLDGRAQNRADLGRVAMSLEDWDAAVTWLSQATELRRGSAAVTFNLSAAYRARYAAEGDVADREQAMELLQRARSQCRPTEEYARCESIEAALIELNHDERENP